MITNTEDTAPATKHVHRPCRGCRKHFTNCACERKMAPLIYKVECPNCGNTFRVSLPTTTKWIQRCSHCMRAFDVTVRDAPTTSPTTAADALVDEVQHRMDAVVDAAVEWHQAGREGAEWFDKAEVLERAIDALMELRASPSTCDECGQPRIGYHEHVVQTVVVASPRTCVKCGHDGEWLDKWTGVCRLIVDGPQLRCGCKCVFPATGVAIAIEDAAKAAAKEIYKCFVGVTPHSDWTNHSVQEKIAAIITSHLQPTAGGGNDAE